MKFMSLSLCSVFLYGCAAFGGSGEIKEKTFAAEVKVPGGTWELRIIEIRDMGEEYWLVLRLHNKGGMGITAICNRKDEVSLACPDKPVKTYVLGKTWRWPNQEPYTFVDKTTEPEFMKKLADGKLLWKRQAEDLPED